MRLKQWQVQATRRIDGRFKPAMVLLVAMATACVAVLPFFGGTFMPDFREGHFVLQVSSSIPGTSLREMLDIGRRISAEVLQLPYIQSVEQQVGRAELSEDTWGPHRSEFHVELKPDAPIGQAEAQDALRRILENYPGIQSEVVTFLGDRIGESLSGETAQVAVKVFGNDLDALDRTAVRIVTALRPIDGVVDLQFKAQGGTPAISIEVSPQAVAATGLKTQDVLDTVETAYAGATVGQTFQGVRTVDTVVLLPENLRREPSQLGHLMIAGSLGPVPLQQVAKLRLTQDRYSIEHDGGQRRVAVTFNVAGRPLSDVVDEAKRKIAQAVTMPPGVFIEFTGAAQAQAQTQQELLIYTALSLVLIVMILFSAFQWRANGWLVLVNIPFSLIGSVLAIAVTGIGLSLGTLVGLVTVFGVSARNAILQLAHYEHLVGVEGAPWNMDTVLRGANERLIPILMTAVVTGLGLAPLAFGIDRPGQEIEGPMAIAVLGGLVSSTVLNLLVLPALAHRFSRPRAVSSGMSVPLAE
jgi:Cu/Ag efflux pump CusA